MRGTLALDVSYAARRPWAPRRAQFDRWARAALAATAARSAAPALPRAAAGQRALSIRVVGALRSRRLNARYRHQDKPTNVLSFVGAGLAPDGLQHLGELVICAPLVAHEAAQQRKSRESHWAHLTVHGVLHLLGFDHERPSEARKMATMEVQILDRLGFSDPYV